MIWTSAVIIYIAESSANQVILFKSNGLVCITAYSSSYTVKAAKY